LNDEILVPSHIEEERTRRILVSFIPFVLRRDEKFDDLTMLFQKVRRRKSKGKKEESPKPVWPPVRKRHQMKKADEKEDARKQKQLTPEQQRVLLSSIFLDRRN
jgi:hypothetical protein